MKIGIPHTIRGLAYHWVPLSLTVVLMAACGGGGGGACGSLGALVTGSVCEKTSPAATTPIPTNRVPVAVLSVPVGAVVGESVVLDGSRSSDPDGQPLAFQWELVGAPTGSRAQLSNAATPQNIFVPDVVGVYQFRLTVSDGSVSASPAVASLSVRRTNTAPVAVASAPPSVLVGQVVTVDGSSSFDEDRDIITYDWALVSKPGDSVTVLGGVASAQPSFIADRAGRYVLSLMVNDGRMTSKATTVAIDAGQRNMPPVAKATEVAPVLTGNTVILSGESSSDPNGDNLRYDWTFAAKPPSSKATISGSATVRPSFVPDSEGDYLVKLVVNDGLLSGEPVFVRVSAANSNQRPSAVIQARRDANVGETVILDGTFSTDPNLDPLSHEWSIISKPQGSEGALQGAAAPKATLRLDKAGQYVVGLKVRDGSVESQVTTHIISATMGNLPPVARASSLAPAVKVGRQVVLSGASSSDPDLGDLIKYQWAIVSRPTGSTAELDDRTSVTPSFVADRAGLFVVGLTVQDAQQAPSNLATVVIEATNNNGAPVARTATVQPVAVGGLAVLDGSASNDPDDDRISYEWRILAKPQGSSGTLALVAGNTVRPTLTPDVEGDYLVQLVVSDGSLRSESSITRVTAVRPVINRPPLAVVQANSTSLLVGATAVIDGSASSDPESGALTYIWSLISAPPATSTNGATSTTGSGGASAAATGSSPLQSSNANRATLIANTAGTYVVGLRVRDPLGLESELATVTVSAGVAARPVAVISVPMTASLNRPLTLDGSQSRGQGSAPLNFKWDVVSSPGAATIAETSASRTTLVPNAPGFWVIRLVVDQERNSAGVPVNPSLPEIAVIEVR